MHRFQHAAMATQFEIRCTHPDGRYARHAARAAFEVVDRLEQQLSRFIENSDITRINHLSPGESTIVSYETMQCLQLASLIYAETGGAFDIALGTGFEMLELVPAEFAVRLSLVPDSGRQGDTQPSSSGLRRAEPPSRFEPVDGVRLDLGGIGKGYAVDRVADVLEDWEIDQVLIDAGSSSVLALEPPAGAEDWPLTISDAAGSGVILANIAARQRALGASGIRKADHIVDPRNRAPVRSRSAAWVSAPRLVLAAIGRQAGVEDSAAAVADALSTAFMISPAEEIGAYCERRAGLEAWILEGTLTHYPHAQKPHNE
jgi:thiamine biosynthesis lipoprotein